MSDQSKLGLGQIITTPQERDAIHVAVAPLECGDCKAWPGVHVGVRDGKFSEEIKPHVGIVDPFLEKAVYAEQKAWIYLYPGSITSLRHVWSHPDFGEATGPSTAPQEVGFITRDEHIQKSVAWIRDEAEHLDITVNQLMSSAEQWIEEEHYTVQYGSEHWRDSFRSKEFWHHYEVVTGKPVPQDKKQSFFCSSC